MTQSERNRNLSKSLPKRFGFLDHAIELLGSQEAGGLIDLGSRICPPESALQHTIMAMQQQFLFQTRPNRVYGSAWYGSAPLALGSIHLKAL
ncbi:MAG: hypothetical protein EOR94_19750 [Mesorhizobium sp.]|nr:MAG: hypothetical protein EOR94_19750 [Mesorhizobium sp.]